MSESEEYPSYVNIARNFDKNKLIKSIKQHFSSSKVHNFISGLVCGHISDIDFKTINYKNRELYAEYHKDNTILHIRSDGGIIFGNSYYEFTYDYYHKSEYTPTHMFRINERTVNVPVFIIYTYKNDKYEIFSIYCGKPCNSEKTLNMCKSKHTMIKNILNRYLIDDIIDIINSYSIEYQIINLF